jgi:hypothetical protein
MPASSAQPEPEGGIEMAESNATDDVREEISDKENHDVLITVVDESTKDEDGAKEDQEINDRHVVLTPKRRIRMFLDGHANAPGPGTTTEVISHPRNNNDIRTFHWGTL